MLENSMDCRERGELGPGDSEQRFVVIITSLGEGGVDSGAISYLKLV